MSPKELQYVEDALGHSREMQCSCKDFASQIQDAELRSFVQGLASQHRNCFSKFYGLLEKNG